VGTKSLRSRLTGGFGAGGITLIGSLLLQVLLGLEWSLGLLLAFESVGVVFIIIAVMLHLTERKKD
jgi:hypothetical protein